VMTKEQADRWSRPVEQLVYATNQQHAPLVEPTLVALETSVMNQDVVKAALIAVSKALRKMGVGSAEFCFFDRKVRESIPFVLDSLIEGTVANVMETVEFGAAPGALLDYLLRFAPGIEGTAFVPVFEHARKLGAKTVYVVTDMLGHDLDRIPEELRPPATIWVALFAERGPTRPFGWKVEFPHA